MGSDAENFESRPLPKSFVIELTRRCNNHCLYCYMPEGPCDQHSERERAREMNAAQVTDIIAKLCDQAPVESIALSGGEPLVREDLPEIVSFVRSKGASPTIITNGTLLTREKAAAIGGDPTYEITLLSPRQEVHDRLAGRRGAWRAAVEGMANVRQLGGNFVAVFVATKLNYMDARRAAELAIALGAAGLMYNRINLGAHNMRQADRLLPTPDMIRQNLDTLEELSSKYNLPVAVSVVIEPCVVDVRKYKRLHFGWCPLGGEGSYFTVDPAGDLRICNHSRRVLGNLKHDRFTDIYYRHPYLRTFHDSWPAECEGCEPELKSMCCGGCKAASEQCYGTLTRIDPFVTISREPPGHGDTTAAPA